MKKGKLELISDGWWAMVGLSASQSDDFDIGVLWDTLIDGYGFSSASIDPATGIITFPTDKTFLLEACISETILTADANVRVYFAQESGTGSLVSSYTNQYKTGSTIGHTGMPFLRGVLSTTSEFELSTLIDSSTQANLSGIFSDYTWLHITQIRGAD